MIKHTDEVFLGPEDILEIDIPPKVSNSAGYQNIVTMVCVFSRSLRRKSGKFRFFQEPIKVGFSSTKMCFQEISKVVHFKENGSAAKMIEEFTH